MKSTWNSFRTEEPVDLESLLAVGIHYQSIVKTFPLWMLSISIAHNDENLWKNEEK